MAVVMFRKGIGVGEGRWNRSEVCVGVYEASGRFGPVGQFCNQVQSGLRDMLRLYLSPGSGSSSVLKQDVTFTLY